MTRGKQPAAVFSAEGLKILLDFIHKVSRGNDSPEDMDAQVMSLINGYEQFQSGEPSKKDRIKSRTEFIEEVVHSAGEGGISVKDLVNILGKEGYYMGANPKGWSSRVKDMVSQSSKVIKFSHGVYKHVDYLGPSSPVGDGWMTCPVCKDIKTTETIDCPGCNGEGRIRNPDPIEYQESCLNCEECHDGCPHFNSMECTVCGNDPEYRDSCTNCDGRGWLKI